MTTACFRAKPGLVKQVRRVAEEMSQSIIPGKAQNPDRAMQVNLIAPSSMSFVLVLAVKSNSDKVTAACAFCDAKIAFGESVCLNCMEKYNIKSYDLGSDGCGCDR